MDFKKIAKDLKIVADEQRLKIIALLSSGERCVGEIREHLGISQPVTSYHLKLLKDIGLVDIRRDNKKVFYSLNGESHNINVDRADKIVLDDSVIIMREDSGE